MRTDVEHLFRAVDQLTAHRRQLLGTLSPLTSPVRALLVQPQPQSSH
ncbi:hypothetical protein [Streptomyces mirabilis]